MPKGDGGVHTVNFPIGIRFGVKHVAGMRGSIGMRGLHPGKV
jgi:hypothetical protein